MLHLFVIRTSSKRRLVTACSYESLLASTKPSSSSTDAVADVADLVQRTIDLASCADGSVEIHPLHGSVLGQQHCFQVSTRAGNTYFACRSDEERREWMDQYVVYFSTNTAHFSAHYHHHHHHHHHFICSKAVRYVSQVNSSVKQ